MKFRIYIYIFKYEQILAWCHYSRLLSYHRSIEFIVIHCHSLAFIDINLGLPKLINYRIYRHLALLTEGLQWTWGLRLNHVPSSPHSRNPSLMGRRDPNPILLLRLWLLYNHLTSSFLLSLHSSSPILSRADCCIIVRVIFHLHPVFS